MNPWDKIGPKGICVYCGQPCYEEKGNHERCEIEYYEWLDSKDFKKLVEDVANEMSKKQ